VVTFVRGRTITTSEPTITVDAGLAVGVHRFQLQVVTADGRRSAADVVEVSVQRLVVPTPVEPVLRPTVIQPAIRPTATTPTTVPGPTSVGTTRLRKPRGAPPQAAVEGGPEATPEPPPAPPAKPGRPARSKRRSES
jgi:hypothetical protein